MSESNINEETAPATDAAPAEVAAEGTTTSPDAAAAAPAAAAPQATGGQGYGGAPGAGGYGAGGPRRGPGGKRFPRRKVCQFCVDKITYIDYKDQKKLRKFVTDRGKILPRRMMGTCAFHQRMLTVAIKRARVIALLPFTAE